MTPSAALAAAQTAVTNAQRGNPVPGTLIATEAAIQAALAALGTSAAATGAQIAAGVVGPLTVASLMGAAGSSAQCAAAWGYTARAASNWLQVPGISTPYVTPQTTPPDLASYLGA